MPYLLKEKYFTTEYSFYSLFFFSTISEGQAIAKTFSSSGGSKIPIKIGSRSRSR